jgi:hypothetical protein
MSEKSKAASEPEQVARANRLRETINDLKRGARPEAKTPRDIAGQAADEAAGEERPASR